MAECKHQPRWMDALKLFGKQCECRHCGVEIVEKPRKASAEGQEEPFFTKSRLIGMAGGLLTMVLVDWQDMSRALQVPCYMVIAHLTTALNKYNFAEYIARVELEKEDAARPWRETAFKKHWWQEMPWSDAEEEKSKNEGFPDA